MSTTDKCPHCGNETQDKQSWFDFEYMNLAAGAMFEMVVKCNKCKQRVVVSQEPADHLLTAMLS